MVGTSLAALVAIIVCADDVPKKVAHTNAGRLGVKTVRWQPNGETVVARAFLGGLSAWNWSADDRKISLILDKMNDGHVMSPTGGFVAIRDLEKDEVTVCSVPDYMVKATFASKHDPEAISDDGKTVAFVVDSVLRLCEAKDGRIVWESRVGSAHMEYLEIITKPKAVLFINDRNLENPSAGSARGELLSLIESWRPTNPPPTLLFRLRALALSNDSSTLAITQSNGDVIIWDTVKGKVISRPRKNRDVVDYDLRFSRDMRWVAMGGDASRTKHAGMNPVLGEAWICEVSSGRQVVSLTFPGDLVRTVDLSPDNAWLAVGCESGELSLWQVKELLK